MRRKTILTALAAVVLVLLVYRHWALTWGATGEEVRRPMPGDEIVTCPTFIATRAVSINAPPESVWPWIIQMGYRRAGFYSYDRLDNDGIPSADRLLPEYQQLKVGDEVPLSPAGRARVAVLEPNQVLVLHFEKFVPFTWTWLLERQPGGGTRLVARIRWRLILPRRLAMDVAEIWMMRKCMLGIRSRAESGAALGS